MEKKRILMVAPLPPPVHGSAMMTQYIKDSNLINNAFDLDWVNLSTSRKMNEIGKTTFVKLWRFALSYTKTFFKLLTYKYDACYFAITCHGLGFLKDAPFVIMAKLLNRGRIIIHQHNKGMSRDVDKFLYKWLFHKVYNNAEVVLLSWHLYPDIEKIVPQNNVHICPNGIPLTKIYSKVKEKNTPQILFLSNLIESKGVFTLLDACKILKEQGYDFHCRFIGGETKEISSERFEEEVYKRGLIDYVIYAGKKFGAEKDKEFAESDIFVFPTFYDNECFPLVLLEALQHKAPIISTSEGGIPDIIIDRKTGLISKQQDSSDLAKKIKLLIDNKSLREELGKAGFEHFKQNFNIHKFETKMLSILSKDSF